MKLEKINYGSAVIFGALSFVLYLALGVMQWIARDELMATYGMQISALSAFVTAPVIGGVSGYLAVLVGIVIYNLVAKRYPISWSVKK